MKVGFSFGRCVRDIVNGEVDINDVAVLITRTHMNTADSVEDVVGEYMHVSGYLKGLDAGRCLEVALQLWQEGKIHQPRVYGTNYSSRPENLIWMDLYPCVKDMNPAVEAAWEQYQMALALVHGHEVPKEHVDESVYRR